MTATDPIAFRTAPPEFDVRQPDLIMPEWWAGTPAIDPARFTIDLGGGPLTDDDLRPGSGLADRMNEVYDEVGLVVLVDTGLRDLAAMRQAALLVLAGEMRYEGGSNPRRPIEPNVFEVGAPLSAWLHYHHEMAYVGKSTRALAFLCKQALPDRGATFFSDSVAATDHVLTTELGRKLRDLGVCYHRAMTDREAFVDRLELGVYNHWQLSMGTDDPGEAQRRAEARGLRTEWGPDRLLKTRYYADAFEYYAPLDRNLLYSSMADHGMWFDGWPLVMHLPHDERPLHMTYGDDSEFSREEREEFVRLYDRFGIRVDWEVGDVAVFCNYRFAHGRPGIELGEGEGRELGVLLGERYDRCGQLPDRW